MIQRSEVKQFYGRKWRGQEGQTTVFVLLALGLFLLATVAFSVDVANLWFHRQTAQSAADAACTAGAMDMLVSAEGGAITGANFTPGTAFNCSSKGTASPCQYAALNSYNGAGLVASSPSNDVSVSFPPQSANPAPGVTPAPLSLAPYSFIRVDVIDRVKVFFMGLLTGSKTQDVRSFAVCGLTLAKAPIPILVLDPQNPPFNPPVPALNIAGTKSSIKILGGPQRSIQVNSADPTAVGFSGNGQINLTRGGPGFTGSDLGVFGGPTANLVKVANFPPSSTGQWISPATPIGDPFAQIPTPSKPAPAPSPIPPCPNGVCLANGCPDPTNGCYEYSAGYYPNGIKIKNMNAIFDPGVYYVEGGFALLSNSLVRPSNQLGDGSGGTIFYLTTSSKSNCTQNQLICVVSDSGTTTPCPATPSCVYAFDSSLVKCPGGPAPDARLGLSGVVFSGNVLLAPCTGTYGDPLGQYRGILFFQDHSITDIAIGGGWA